MAMFGWNIADDLPAVKRLPSADVQSSLATGGPRNLWSGRHLRCMLRYAVRRKIAGEEVSTCTASIRRPSK
jgi:hypothetical protein